MADTLPNVPITKEDWKDVYDLTSIPTGTPIALQNTGVSDLRFSISPTKPAIDNNSYKIFLREDTINAEDGDVKIWVFSPQKDGEINVEIQVPEPVLDETAFGELKVESDTPITQIGAEFGLLGQVLTVVDSAASGSTTVVGDKFTCQSGVASDGLASISSLRQAKTRVGQGINVRFDATFTTGVANSRQAAGLITSENSYAFAFAGAVFGISYAHSGISESQELTITTEAAGSEDATITVNGIEFTVPLTAGTVQHNAFEISNSLNAQVPNYDFTSNDDQVVAQSLLPGVQGSFAFSSSTAVASWFQTVAGVFPIIVSIAQTSWNIDTRLIGDTEDILDPTKGNNYQIKLSSNFGAVRFYIEDSNTGELILVHIIKGSNLKTNPNVTTPIFRLGWLAQNLGNTSNLICSGNSAAGFVEGLIRRSVPSRSANNNQLAVGAILTNIITFRNRLHFKGKINRTEIFPILATVSTETNKVIFVEIIANPTFGGDVDFSYVDKENSIMEIATDQVTVSGGRVIDSFTVAPGSSVTRTFNQQDNVEFLALPNQTFSIAALISSGAAGDVQGTGTWKEDF